ncbi:MAG: oligosaccharide flippase family protein [Candidatus Vogelbacteria bacterium]|nr:oligosaccharide flippase family protein [Candidatus Vogelbacteria bacterium]
MIKRFKSGLYQSLRYSERYTKTDMVYLASGGFWVSIGHVVSTLSGLALSLAFANLLPETTYGIYKYIMSIVAILAIPTLSGLDGAIAQAIMKGYDGSFWNAYKTKLRWGVLGGIGSLFVAGYYFFSGDQTLSACFLITAFFLPIVDIFNLYGSILYGKKDFRNNYIFYILIQIISTISIITALFLTNNIYFILLSYFLPLTIARYVMLQWTIKIHSLNNRIESDTISYGKHLSLMNVINLIAAQMDKILVFHFIGAAELAIYSFAVALPEQIRSLAKGVFTVGLPKIAAIDDETHLRQSLRQKTLTLTIIFGLITLIYILIAPFIYQLLFPRYLASIGLSQLYSIGLITIPAISILSMKYTLDKNIHVLYRANVASGLLNIILSFVLISNFGLTGAVIKNTVSWVFLMILNYYYFQARTIPKT